MIAIGGVTILGLIGLVGWFCRRLITELEKKVDAGGAKVAELNTLFNNWRVTVEQNFVSFDTFETMRVEFRKNFQDIFKEQAEAGKILARLEERSNNEERFNRLIEAITKGKR